MTSDECPVCRCCEIDLEREVFDQSGNQAVVLRCASCGMSRRKLETPRERYHTDENEITYSDQWAIAKGRELGLPGYEGTWRDRYEFALGDLEVNEAKRPRVLEVGCGIGHNLAAFRRFGCDVVGVEPSSAAVRFARERFGLDVREAYLEDADLDGSSFDLVVIDNVLEHLPDPVGTLQLIADLLVKGGRIFVDVPNLNAWEGRLLGNRWGIFEEGHLNFFTPESLERTIIEAGFRLSKMCTYEALVTWGNVLEEFSKRLIKKSIPSIGGKRSGSGDQSSEGVMPGRSLNQGRGLGPTRRRQVENATWLGIGYLLTPLRRIQCRKGGGQNIWALAVQS